MGVIGLNMLGKAQELRFSDINPFLPAAVERTLEGLSEVGGGGRFFWGGLGGKGGMCTLDGLSEVGGGVFFFGGGGMGCVCSREGIGM